MSGLRHAGRTHVGRVRDRNEDNWAADEALGLYVVSDGIGGAPAGEVAAERVVTALPRLVGQHVSAPAGDGAEDELRAALAALNDELRDGGRDDPGLRGMGATVVAALVAPETPAALIGHLGDSRAYRWRAGAVQRLTSDHSLAQALVDAGEISAAAAVGHPASAQLLRHVGMAGDALPDVRQVELAAGDRLLLCSDGLTGLVDDAGIAALLAEHTDPGDACQALVDAANEAGGHDNITVLVLDPAAG